MECDSEYGSSFSGPSPPKSIVSDPIPEFAHIFITPPPMLQSPFQSPVKSLAPHSEVSSETNKAVEKLGDMDSSSNQGSSSQETSPASAESETKPNEPSDCKIVALTKEQDEGKCSSENASSSGSSGHEAVAADKKNAGDQAREPPISPSVTPKATVPKRLALPYLAPPDEVIPGWIPSQPRPAPNPPQAERQARRPPFYIKGEREEARRPPVATPADREVQRLSFLLQQERQTSYSLRKKIEEMETAIEKKHDAAMSTILADLFRRQVATLQNKVNLEKLEASLSKRAQDIQQTEVYLAEGQRILTDKLRGQNVDTKSLEALQITNAYNQGRVASEIQYQHIERSWQAKTDSFELRKQNLKMREEACMATARDRLAKELRNDIEYELESEVSDGAYRRGFEAGKEEGMRIQGGWKLPPVPPPVRKGLFDDILPAPAMHNGCVILAGYGGKKESQEKGEEKEEKKGKGKASAIPNLIDI